MIDAFDKFNIAADYAVAALGREGADLARVALQNGSLTDEERKTLAPFSDAISRMLGLDPFRPKGGSS